MTTEYLERFLRNLLLGEKNALRNRDMHISGAWEKQDIDLIKQDIGIPNTVTRKTKAHIEKLFEAFGYEMAFGRADVMKLLDLIASPSLELLRKLLSMELIEAVTGRGKGKYVFNH